MLSNCARVDSEVNLIRKSSPTVHLPDEVKNSLLYVKFI